MTDFFTRCFEWPTLPMTAGLMICIGYWLLVVVGLLDLDGFDFDLDVDWDANASITGIGFISLRFLNLGNVPLMLWASVFTLSGWLASMLLDPLPRPEPWRDTAVALARNIGIALVATKLLTNPLRGRFDAKQPNQVEDILGRHCVITSSEVTERFGQARLDAEAAPLLLNVRSEGDTFARDDVAVLVDYLPAERVYLVKPLAAEDATNV